MPAKPLRSGAIALLLTLMAALAGCGDREPASGPPGSVDNPIASGAERDGTDPDAPGAVRPGYRDLVSGQPRTPQRRDSPCALVTRKQAEAIVGGRLLAPFEAPQGPTCIYRDRGGETFVSLAVQRLPFSRVRRQVDRLRSVTIANRRAYCGVHGAPMLYLPLRHGRVLSVTGQCDVAVRFARMAVPRLDG